MSTLIQLLTNYYKSVITSDRIYYDHTNHGIMNHRDLPPINGNGSSNSSSGSEREMLLLQRQVHQLTGELQRQSHENDSLKELQKTQRALMESKLNNCKKTIERLKKQSNNNVVNKDTVENGDEGGQLKRREQHLLSPLPGRKLEGVGKTKGLRRALKSRQHTLFDDDDDDYTRDGTADRINDVNFVGSIRQTGGKDDNNNNGDGDKLAQAIITSAGISEEEEDEQKQEEKPLNKKRKLARKRIQKVNPDSEGD